MAHAAMGRNSAPGGESRAPNRNHLPQNRVDDNAPLFFREKTLTLRCYTPYRDGTEALVFGGVGVRRSPPNGWPRSSRMAFSYAVPGAVYFITPTEESVE